MRRTGALVVIWVVGCAVAVGFGTLAVAMVGSSVTDRSVVPVSRQQVEAELADPALAASAAVPAGEPGSAVATTATTTAAGRADGDPTTGQAAGADPSAPAVAPTTTAASGAAPTRAADDRTTLPATTTTLAVSVSGGVSGGGSGSSGGSGSGSGGGSGSGSSPGGPALTTTTLPALSQQTFTLTGGVASVSCSGSTVALLSSSPALGFTVTVLKAGPTDVEVDFTSATHLSELKVRCSGGVIQGEVKESARNGG